MKVILILLLVVFGSFFIYNLLVGTCFLSIRYYMSKQKNLNRKEWITLILYPTVGLGNWMYKKEINKNGVEKFPQEWFLWKYRIPLNIGYLVFIGVIAIISYQIFLGDAGGGTDLAKDADNVYSAVGALAVDVTTTVLSGIALFFLVIVLIIVYIGVALLLILIPIGIVKSIEANYYKEKALLRNFGENSL